MWIDLTERSFLAGGYQTLSESVQGAGSTSLHKHIQRYSFMHKGRGKWVYCGKLVQNLHERVQRNKKLPNLIRWWLSTRHWRTTVLFVCTIVLQMCFLHLQFRLSSSSSAGLEFSRGRLWVFYLSAALFSAAHHNAKPFLPGYRSPWRGGWCEYRSTEVWRAKSQESEGGGGVEEVWIM